MPDQMTNASAAPHPTKFWAVEGMRDYATMIHASRNEPEGMRQFGIPAVGLNDLHINQQYELQFSVDPAGTPYALTAEDCLAVAQFFSTMGALLGAKP